MICQMRVIQDYRATRTIVFGVEAEDFASAKEAVASGAEDIPSFDDPGWQTTWDLQDEVVIENIQLPKQE